MSEYLTVADQRLEYVWIGPPPSQAPTIVFLHEGLGSITQWRDFPASLCQGTGLGGLVYARRGHGSSEPRQAPHAPDFMHAEALTVLPAVLAALGIERPVLFGHSDGASIAIIATGAGRVAPRGVVLEAPHVFVETMTTDQIARLRDAYGSTDLGSKLARHHGPNTVALFEHWSNVWLNDAFTDWNIEAYLAGIRCPVLVIQGEDDEYGSLAQVDAVVRGTGGAADTLLVPGCGHAPHLQHADIVRARSTAFVRGLIEATA